MEILFNEFAMISESSLEMVGGGQVPGLSPSRGDTTGLKQRPGGPRAIQENFKCPPRRSSIFLMFLLFSEMVISLLPLSHFDAFSSGMSE